MSKQQYYETLKKLDEFEKRFTASLAACKCTSELFGPDVVVLRVVCVTICESLLRHSCYATVEASPTEDVELRLWRSAFYAPISRFRSLAGTSSPREMDEVNFSALLLHASGCFQGIIRSLCQRYGLALSGFLDAATMLLPKDDTDGNRGEDSNVKTMSLVTASSSDFSLGPSVKHVCKLSKAHKRAYRGVHHCLVILGDLSRYAATHGKRAKMNLSIYASIRLYKQALLLFPGNAKPHHQLAILALQVYKRLGGAERLLSAILDQIICTCLAGQPDSASTASSNIAATFKHNHAFNIESDLPLSVRDGLSIFSSTVVRIHEHLFYGATVPYRLSTLTTSFQQDLGNLLKHVHTMLELLDKYDNEDIEIDEYYDKQSLQNDVAVALCHSVLLNILAVHRFSSPIPSQLSSQGTSTTIYTNDAVENILAPAKQRWILLSQASCLYMQLLTALLDELGTRLCFDDDVQDHHEAKPLGAVVVAVLPAVKVAFDWLRIRCAALVKDGDPVHTSLFMASVDDVPPAPFWEKLAEVSNAIRLRFCRHGDDVDAWWTEASKGDDVDICDSLSSMSPISLSYQDRSSCVTALLNMELHQRVILPEDLISEGLSPFSQCVKRTPDASTVSVWLSRFPLLGLRDDLTSIHTVRRARSFLWFARVMACLPVIGRTNMALCGEIGGSCCKGMELFKGMGGETIVLSISALEISQKRDIAMKAMARQRLEADVAALEKDVSKSSKPLEQALYVILDVDCFTRHLRHVKALLSLRRCQIIVSLAVVAELDRLKLGAGNVNRGARDAIRYLEGILSSGTAYLHAQAPNESVSSDIVFDDDAVSPQIRRYVESMMGCCLYFGQMTHAGMVMISLVTQDRLLISSAHVLGIPTVSSVSALVRRSAKV